MSHLSLSGAHANLLYESFGKLDGTNVEPNHLLQLMSLPSKLAFDLANWIIFGILLEEEV